MFCWGGGYGIYIILPRFLSLIFILLLFFYFFIFLFFLFFRYENGREKRGGEEEKQIKVS
jgi:uncharacterized membrane protein